MKTSAQICMGIRHMDKYFEEISCYKKNPNNENLVSRFLVDAFIVGARIKDCLIDAEKHFNKTGTVRKTFLELSNVYKDKGIFIFNSETYLLLSYRNMSNNRVLFAVLESDWI